MSSHFDLVDFRLFANIAAASSFTVGAENSNLSTSAASLRIRHLEESLGGKLFHRTSQGSTLTPAGEACLVRIRTILQEFENMKADLRRYSEEDGNRLTIAASNAGVNEPLPGVIRAFTNLYPEVRIALHVRMSNEILGALADGLADIGIGASGRSSNIETVPYLSDRLVLVMAPGHPLAAFDALRFADALAYEIIGLPEEANTQKFMRRIAQSSRRPMRSPLSVSSQEGLFQMVEAGLGIGVISERVAKTRATNAALKLVRLKDKTARSDISISVAGQRNMSDHARRFVEMLQGAA